MSQSGASRVTDVALCPSLRAQFCRAYASGPPGSAAPAPLQNAFSLNGVSSHIRVSQRPAHLNTAGLPCPFLWALSSGGWPPQLRSAVSQWAFLLSPFLFLPLPGQHEEPHRPQVLGSRLRAWTRVGEQLLWVGSGVEGVPREAAGLRLQRTSPVSSCPGPD